MHKTKAKKKTRKCPMVQFKTWIPDSLRDQVRTYAETHDLAISQVNRWALAEFITKVPSIPKP